MRTYGAKALVEMRRIDEAIHTAIEYVHLEFAPVKTDASRSRQKEIYVNNGYLRELVSRIPVHELPAYLCNRESDQHASDRDDRIVKQSECNQPTGLQRIVSNIEYHAEALQRCESRQLLAV